MKKFWLALSIGCVALLGGIYLQFYYHQSGTVILKFRAIANNTPLEFNQPLYSNPGGEGHFSVRNFQFYLSNVQLVGKHSRYKPSDSYHLARFDNDTKSYQITLKDVPYDEYSGVQISIGVDDQANASIMPRGDLDPNSRMAWSWEVGYKFVLFEGDLSLTSQKQALVYHLGFSENLKILQFELNSSLVPNAAPLNFTVDVMALFNASQTINMAELPSVKFDRQDANRLAENYALMLSLASTD
ncbi:MbnP family protein [uncultured Paraglaciecola sp.]|uniref:MbnP family protein n=1 Tax=uncultured Paraglaciecola sp. TaxID=1765024 RepID=UPI00262B4C9B|nr:MbnP family protein [uncultured Paraglaciecola sp.]